MTYPPLPRPSWYSISQRSSSNGFQSVQVLRASLPRLHGPSCWAPQGNLDKCTCVTSDVLQKNKRWRQRCDSGSGNRRLEAGSEPAKHGPSWRDGVVFDVSYLSKVVRRECHRCPPARWSSGSRKPNVPDISPVYVAPGASAADSVNMRYTTSTPRRWARCWRFAAA